MNQRASGVPTDQPLDGQQAPNSPARRRFLVRLSAGLVATTAALASVPLIGFLFSPVIRRDPATWRVVGGLEDFPIGETVKVRFLDPAPVPWAGYAGRSAAWLRRDAPRSFTAFSMYCTHTGCPVSWEAGAKLFMCPCHGGVFYEDGRVAAGPPPRPLERLQVRVRNGQVEIHAVGAPLPG